jgi:hypothetical protein
VSQIGNKDAAALTAARTSDVRRLGIHFFGSHNYGRVRTSLGLVAGDDIAMAEVAKLGSDDGSFMSVNRAIGTELGDRNDIAVGQAHAAIVATNKKPVSYANFDISWFGNIDPGRVPAGLERFVASVKIDLVAFDSFNHHALASGHACRFAIERNHKPRAVVAGVTHLLASPLKRMVSENLPAFGQNTCFFEMSADGVGKSMVLGPGGRNGESSV